MEEEKKVNVDKSMVGYWVNHPYCKFCKYYKRKYDDFFGYKRIFCKLKDKFIIGNGKLAAWLCSYYEVNQEKCTVDEEK